MRELVIDTATEALSVALFADRALVAYHHEIAGRGHAEKLIPIIAALPDGGRADSIIVNRGPGSFTGVRVGLAAARALGYAWQAPVKAYSTLTLLASIAREQSEAAHNQLCIAINGGHGELFWQMFSGEDLTPLSEIRSTPITELAAVIDAPAVYGSGAVALAEAGCQAQAVLLHPDARMAQLLPASALCVDTVPLYGRGADAVPALGSKG